MLNPNDHDDPPREVSFPEVLGNSRAGVCGRAETHFSEWAASIRPRLVVLAQRFLWNRHDSEEVAQDALVLAWRHVGKLDDPGRQNAWIYRTTINLSLNRLRRRRARRLREGQAPPGCWNDGAPPSEESDELAERVRIAVSQLPERQQAALVLREMEGLAYEEVAAIVNVSTGAARLLVHRAREQARQILLRRWPDCFGMDR